MQAALPSTADESDVPAPSHRDRFGFLAAAVLVTAMAAAMGWGIRGQYGHEMGAMIPGALASLTLVMLFAPATSLLWSARAAAMMTIAVGIGGSMTYGQTLGLTHSGDLVGNWSALRWGMLGLFVKGGLWIGFGGALLGMGLSGKRYQPLEMAMLMLVLVGLMFLGIWTINAPYDPVNRVLPALYFSANWDFQPDADLKPRPEVWGGFLVSLVGLIGYVRFVREDRLAARLALWGVLGGGLGFSGGQCLQAFHNWNPDVFTDGALAWASGYTEHFNWWNMMETTFGAIWGGVLATGVWLNRHLIRYDASHDVVEFPPVFEVALLVVHLALLLIVEYIEFVSPFASLNNYIEYGLIMATIPLVTVIGGRIWPYAMLPTVVAIPICVKTLLKICEGPDGMTVATATLLYLALPMLLCLPLVAWVLSREKRIPSCRYVAMSLLLSAILFFFLNTAAFGFAWPWLAWTTRTPSQLIFSVCCGVVSFAACLYLASSRTKQHFSVRTD